MDFKDKSFSTDGCNQFPLFFPAASEQTAGYGIHNESQTDSGML